MGEIWELAGNFMMSTAAQIYPFRSYTDPMALMIADACLYQGPGQVHQEHTSQRQTGSHVSEGLLAHGTSLGEKDI